MILAFILDNQFDNAKTVNSILPEFQLSEIWMLAKSCLLLKKSTSFPDFISEKIISIDKILAFLQAFEHAISMFTTA